MYFCSPNTEKQNFNFSDFLLASLYDEVLQKWGRHLEQKGSFLSELAPNEKEVQSDNGTVASPESVPSAPDKKG